MAKIATHKPMPPAVINKFLGLNENKDGQYGLKLGEASSMLNWRITPGYQLKKREGYACQIRFEVQGRVRGMWYGVIGGHYHFLLARAGYVAGGRISDNTALTLTQRIVDYYGEDCAEDPTVFDQDTGDFCPVLYTFGDEAANYGLPVTFTQFGDKVYILTGEGFYSYDGAAVTTVAGYRPLVYVNAPYTGGGTLYEQINVLTGAKHMTFSPDGSHATFQLAEKSIASVDFVKLNGTALEASEWSVTLSTGVVTLTSTPAEGTGTLDIGWTKGAGQRAIVEKNRFCMLYNGQNSNRAHMWGNPDAQNRRIWSGLEDQQNGGRPSMEYWEANAYDDVCGKNFAITDIVTQYEAQRIFTDGAGAYYSVYSTVDMPDGTVKAEFRTKELNRNIGNVAPGQVQVLSNSPITLYKGVRSWDATTVANQVNEKLMSQRVNDSLLLQDLKNAVTVNWQDRYEYWICIGSTAWVWNYQNDTWYKFSNVPATCFLVIEGTLYFGGNAGVFAFADSLANDDGAVISALWESGFTAFGYEWLKKYMVNLWLSMKPEANMYIKMSVVTDVDGTSSPMVTELSMRLMTFLHMDFNHFSFKTSYNPQPFYIEAQAMNFDFMKLALMNDKLNSNATVLSIVMPIRLGGKVQ